VRNPGGHSSRPRDDNAIYDLASAVKAIEAHRFPVMWSEMTLSYFQMVGEKVGGELGDAMVRFAYDPQDEAAAERLRSEPSYVGTTRTTCVVTMLEAGHAENALPQSATATVNCRIFPGVSVEDIERELRNVVGNEEAEFVLLGEPTESPISELRADVLAALSKAVHGRYPGLDLISYMESGGTDGMHFRKAGVPTWGISSIFMNPDEMYAHGLNERVPIKAFYDGLDHWDVDRRCGALLLHRGHEQRLHLADKGLDQPARLGEARIRRVVRPRGRTDGAGGHGGQEGLLQAASCGARDSVHRQVSAGIRQREYRAKRRRPGAAYGR
jgi:carboxypeptidase PM20D1